MLHSFTQMLFLFNLYYISAGLSLSIKNTESKSFFIIIIIFIGNRAFIMEEGELLFYCGSEIT